MAHSEWVKMYAFKQDTKPIIPKVLQNKLIFLSRNIYVRLKFGLWISLQDGSRFEQLLLIIVFFLLPFQCGNLLKYSAETRRHEAHLVGKLLGQPITAQEQIFRGHALVWKCDATERTTVRTWLPIKLLKLESFSCKI